MTPEKMRQIRKQKLRLSQNKLGAIIGRSGRQISQMELGNPKGGIPKWMPRAMYCILMLGEKEPFEE